MLDLLKKSLLDAQIIKRDEYSYFVHPLTDAIPKLEPELLEEVCRFIKDRFDTDVDSILTMEAMGIHIAAVLSHMVGVPINILRKRHYGLAGELALEQSTGYSKGKLYINAVDEGDRILIVDAVISTGGTLTAVINGLKKIGAEITDVVCVIDRDDGVQRVKQATGVDVRALVKIEVNGKVRIVDSMR